ncbi:MAG: hypothetical protein EAZ90_28500 [Oscillatoriales cyanobacterium]|nr:MAG: hypothetical protein EAZ94_32480 [Oscillatoriales cyanobacterium]TAE19026.1 MAG: hypothetical protein EAZ93_28095 [Oscillatoriales cyanobacterium]TAE36392.1 MAG: hypothetical protein EAZ90_28500 [Oscillatoriales cyanobacterium]TAE65682.1 MAG: hypothetical protein EAZ86_23475 [Oscillatoriales cyanobacterium]TAF89754.1 MAG: hypothetical protein EAZ49_11710 [Oscillatoriales cyanobacterium]
MLASGFFPVSPSPPLPLSLSPPLPLSLSPPLPFFPVSPSPPLSFSPSSHFPIKKRRARSTATRPNNIRIFDFLTNEMCFR